MLFGEHNNAPTAQPWRWNAGLLLLGQADIALLHGLDESLAHVSPVDDGPDVAQVVGAHVLVVLYAYRQSRTS